MTWFGNLKTMWKLMLGFVLLGAVTALASLAINAGIVQLQENLRIVYEDYTVAGTDLARTANNVMRYRNNVILGIGTASREDFQRFYEL